MLTAHTREIDFADEALEEILSQLDIKNNLLKNAVGVLHCGYEFVDGGFVELLNEKLPFDLVGGTTFAAATDGEYGSELLSLSVLTSDDVSFSVARSAPVTPENIDEALGAAYRRAAAALPETPALVLAQMPYERTIGVSQFLDGVSRAGDGVPVFGTLPCDETPDDSKSCVFCNGETFDDAAALLLMSGNVRPRFFVENTCSSEDLLERQGLITESDGCLLKRVNDMIFLDYIRSLGISSDAINETKYYPVPFKVNYSEGTKSLIRVLFSVTPEGHAVFTSEMPVGCTFSIQHFDYNSVMQTTESMAETLGAQRDASCVFLYSCSARSFLLGRKLNDEMRKLSAFLNGKMPYQFAYSNSEICPLEDAAGAFVNYTHNYSLIACVL
jgi:hypothetical protein